MSEFKDFINNYWNYYKELENEVIATQKYVHFHEDNFHTYSIEYLKLFQAICSEIDVIGKAMAYYVNPNFKPEDLKNNIYKWWYVIQSQYLISTVYSDIGNRTIKLSSYSESFMKLIDITPWSGFEVEQFTNRKGSVCYRSNSTHPDWWTDYNHVKHNRTTIYNGRVNYSKANLKNVCYALTALYTLEKAYMECLGTKNELEAFADYSLCFDYIENSTTEDVNKMFSTIF